MAQFLPAHTITRKHEGNYADVPGDAGGKTYAGIAYNFFPNWSGWSIVSAYEKQLGRKLKWKEAVPGIEPSVESFYKTQFWDKNRFGEISSQEVANILYDFTVNSGSKAISATQEILNLMGENLTVDGGMGPKTLAAINRQDANKLNDAIKAYRIQFYNELANAKRNYVVQAGETQSSIAKKFRLPIDEIPVGVVPGQTIRIRTMAQFLNGWLDRINQFPTLLKAGIGLGVFLLIAGIFFLITSANSDERRTDKDRV